MPLSRPSPGGNEGTPLILTPIGGAGGAAWGSVTRAVWVKFRLAKARTIAGLRVGVVSASGNAKAGIYQSDGATLTQLALSVSTAVTGTNVKQDIPFIAAVQAVAAQDYWAMLAADNTSVQFLRQNIAAAALASGFDVCYFADSAFATPPTPQLISGLTGSALMPIIGLI